MSGPAEIQPIEPEIDDGGGRRRKFESDLTKKNMLKSSQIP